MRDTWQGSIRDVIVRAIDEASDRGSVDVEAEHLLLAVAADPALPGARALAHVGWDHPGIVAALDAERATSLSAVGVAPVDPAHLRATRRPGRPGWGASARAAISRAGLGVGRSGRRTASADADLVRGVLEARIGTVPRMLAFAGIDRDALMANLTAPRAA